jgi:lysozyme
MTHLLVDLSNRNKTVDLAKLAASKMVDGVFHKATEGQSFVDDFYADRRAEAKKLGLHFGAYHFARPDLHPTAGGARTEASHFCDVVGKVGLWDLRPALDYETRANVDNLAWIAAFNTVVKKRLGVWPMFYSYFSLIVEMKLPRPVGDGLWLSAFDRNDGVDHGFQTPAPWKKTAGHQFTSHGSLPGVAGDVDLTHAPSLVPFLAHPTLGLVIPQAPWLSRL